MIFKAILGLKQKNRGIDIISVGNALQEMDKLQAIGGQLTMEHMIDKVPTIAHVEHYLEIIREYYWKRKDEHILTEHLQAIYSERSHDENMNLLQAALSGNTHSDTDVMTKADIKKAAIENQAQAEENGFIGLPSKFYPLQNKLGGYAKGKTIIIAGRPSAGKTTFALNEARHWAEQGYKIGIVSLETEIVEIYETMAGEKAGIDLFKRRKGEIDTFQESEFQMALDQVLELPIHVTSRSMDIDHICNWIHFMCFKYKLDAVVVDYVQIILQSLHMKRMGPREQISYFSNRLFGAAKANNVALVAVCQINRAAEPPHGIKPEDKWKYTPKLHHLKESGKLEEDAFQALIVYPDPFEIDPEQSLSIRCVVDVAKNKRGPRGKVALRYNKSLQAFSSKESYV
jgi:replicative DNA helicase